MTPRTPPSLLRRGVRTLRAMIALQPRMFAVAVGGATVFALATAGSSAALGRVTDRVIVPRFENGSVPAGTVVAGVGLVILVGLVKATGIVVRRVAATLTGARVGAQLRTGVVDRYQAVPYGYHRSTPTGELLAHAVSDVDASTEVLGPLPYSTGVVVILLVSTIWLLVTDLWLALVGLTVFPLLALANLLYQRIEERPAEEAQRRIGDVSAVAHESFDGALVVKALGAEALESERFRAASTRLRDAKIRAASIRAVFDTLLDALPALGTLLLLPVGAWRVQQGAITTGTVVSFVSLFQLLVFPLRLFGYLLGELPRAVVGYARVAGVLAEPGDPRHERTGAGQPAGGTGARGARLEVKGVGFAYEPGLPVLDGVQFTVEPGRVVAVVGPTGCGKSSLLLLVAGLLRPDTGAIRLDGRSLDDLSVAELRAEVAIAFQEAFLFADSIEENVLLGLPEDGLGHALALAGADAFVAALPQGTATVVGERGATLSGGQRQRIALARALVRRPRLLLLDDATSAVDPTTEARILAALDGELAGTTTLVVASRPATIALADEVLFLEAGRLVDHGTHAELLARQPAYARMVHAYELDRADREGVPASGATP